MNENSFEKPIEPEKEKREMSKEEIKDFGNEIEELIIEMKDQADDIKQELLNPNLSEEEREELEENLEMILIQFSEEWKEFVSDAKDGCDARIDKETDK